jgi:hypothetical protein
MPLNKTTLDRFWRYLEAIHGDDYDKCLDHALNLLDQKVFNQLTAAVERDWKLIENDRKKRSITK